MWSLHAGVNTGRVVQRDDDLFGSAINVASRLADRAGPRQVDATGQVIEQLGDDHILEATPVGAPALKGISEQVEVFEVPARVTSHIDYLA